MVVAYLRVSTEKQQLENQKEEIERFVRSQNFSVDQWHTETVSGTVSKSNRTLGPVLSELSRGDIIVVSEISRLSRKMLEIMTILNTCIEHGITLYCVKEGFRFADDMNSKIMGFAFGMSAEIERSLISSRTKEALAYRRSQGVILGRPIGSACKQKVLQKNQTEIYSMIENRIPLSTIAKTYEISRTTLYTFLKSNQINVPLDILSHQERC